MKRIILPIVAFLISHFSYAQVCTKAQLPNNLQNGLVAFYPFCGNANDGSGNLLNATLNQGTLVQDRFGNTSSAISLNGTSQLIEFPINASYNTSTFSISFWTKGNSYNIHNKVQLGVAGGALRWSLNWNETNNYYSPMTCAGGYATNSNSFNSGIPLRQWNHIVYVVEGTSTKVYKNGVYDGVQNTASALTCFNTSMKLCFGGDIGGGSIEYYDGAFDDIFFYDRAISSSEVSQLFLITNTGCNTPDITNFIPFSAQSSICGTSTTLNAGAGYTSYLWSTGATSQTISATTPGEYRVTVTNAAGCSASDTISVNFIKADIIQANQTVCANTTLNLFIDSTFSGSVINAKSQMSANLQTGLVAFYPFTGNASDVSGNNNVLTANGVTLTTDRFGRSNSAYSFTNTQTSVTNYLKAVNPTPFAKNSYTISAWFNSRQFYPNIGGVTYNYQSIVFYSPQWYTYGPAYHLSLQHANNSILEGGNWTTTNTNQALVSANGSIIVNQWYHVVLSYDGTTLKMYKDGQLVGSRAATISYANQIQFLIGGAGDGPSPGGIYGGFNGKIDDVGFWDRALTYNEIQELYIGRPSVLWSTSETTNKISVTPAVTTKYYATLTDGIATCTDSVTITIDNIAAFNPFTAQLTSCGTTKSLDAGAGFTNYLWNTGATSQTISSTVNGDYTVTVTNAAGCSASDTVAVSIVKADILQNNSTICKGTSITLSVDSSFTAQGLINLNLLPANLKVGLKAYYPFSGNANDASGNINNGIVTGATLTADRFGNANSAYSFNGSSFIDLGNISGVGYSASQDITTSFWINEGALGTVISKYTNLDAANSNFFFSKAANTAQVAGDGTNSFPANNITDYRWTNYVLIASAGSNKSFLYRNGILIATGTLNANGALSATKLMLGKLMGSPSNFFTGKMDDVFIYNRVLSVAEIAQLSNFQPKVSWSTGATTNTISVSPMVTTKYFATISDGITTCRDSVTITVDDLSAFNPLQDTVKVCGDSTVLDAGAGFATYNWSNGATTRTIAPKASGKYYVKIANASGCAASDTSVVSIVKAKILQKDTTICKGGTISLSADTITNRLLAYYPLDNNAQDLSGNNMNGAVTGATPTTDRFGQANKAYFFNGTSDFIKVNHDSRLNSLPLTVSCWFNANQQISSSGALVGKYYAASWTGWQLTLNETGPSSQRLDPWYIRNSSNYVKNNSATPNFYTTPVIDSSWHHVAFVIDSTSGKIYLDGSLQATASWVGPAGAPSNSWPMYFGYYPSGNAQPNVYYYRGKIDDIRLYDKALNSSEVQSAMSSSISNYQYLWSTGATTPTIQVNPTTTTKYFVTVSDGITTCTDSVVVNVSSSELKLTDPAAVCSPGVINLTAAAVTSGSAAGLTYTYWKDANATQALANPDKVSVSGTYYIVGKSATGCTSAPTAVKVTVNPLPVATIVTPSQTTICDKSTLTLTARGGTSYQWLYNSAAIAGAIDSIYAASLAGSYEVNVIALGCTSKVATPVNLSLIKAAVPKFSNSSTCIDVPVSFFNETDTTSSGSVSWVWDFGDGQTSTLLNPVYTYKKTGTFIVKLTVTPKLCSSLPANVTKSITVDIPPVGIKYPNVLAVKNKATPLSARFIANGYSYLWMPSTGLNNGAIQKPLFNFSQEQLYRVRLTSASGCITMDTVKVSVYDSSDIFVPKAFSPNKDGKNDILQPFLVNITTLKFFRVYSRWGQLMFQSSDSKQGWDGMFNNNPQPLETYTWIAEGVDGNGTTIFRKGQTVLIR